MNLLKKQWGLLSSVFFLSRIFLSSCNGQCSLICLSLEIAVSLMGKNWAAYPFSQKVLVISCGRKEEEENPFCTLPQFPMVFFFFFFFCGPKRDASCSLFPIYHFLSHIQSRTPTGTNSHLYCFYCEFNSFL